MDEIPDLNAISKPSAPPNTTVLPGQDPDPSLDESWLHDFYKECGRETTLAYTTLNQMKNWAMVIAAAAISGLAFGSKSSEYPTPIMFAGSVIVYTFVLRFFVRAMLCYINLERWNLLQADCVEVKLLASAKHRSNSQHDLTRKLREDIQKYYFEWLSPISRKDQIFKNLKLGFYLLFGLALFFLGWGAVVLWQDHLVKGLTTFAVLNTVLETLDFSRSRYFDDARASERRRAEDRSRLFPVPDSRGGFMAGWIFNVAISSIVVAWPHVQLIFWRLWCK